MPRPCEGRHDLDPAACRVCWLYTYDAAYQRLWGGAAPPGPAAAVPAACAHLGGEPVGLRDCPSCGGRVRLKEFACAAGLGVAGRAVPSRDCGPARCPGYRRRGGDPPVGSTRHLLLHVYPARHAGTWQRALDQLKPRLGLFNGRRVVAVVTEDCLDPPGMVEEHLDGCGCDVLAVPNDCTLREVATWHHLWDRVPVGAEGAGHATFYAHAKGVTRPADPGNSCHLWAWLLWHVLLDYWPLVLHELRDHGHPLAGCLKKLGNGFPGSRSAWHYSGSFFWARNDGIARDQLAAVDRCWWGTESWPGSHFPPSAAGNLFHEGFVPHQGPRNLDMYDFGYLKETVTPELDAWRRERAEHLTFWGADGERIVY